MTSRDTDRAHTTVSFPVLQLNAVKMRFVATRIAPITYEQHSGKLTLNV
jgi:hypothetical protein